jgi:signal transduction histidine kinase
MPFVPSKIRSKIRSSVSFRIAFLFSLTFALGLIVTFTLTYFQLGYSLEQSSKEVISAKLLEVSAILGSENVEGLKKFLATDEARILNAPFMIRVRDSSGETIYLKPSIQRKHFDFSAAFGTKVSPQKSLGWNALAAINDEDMFDFLTEKAGPDFYLQVGKSSEDRELILENILEIFDGMGLLLIILGGGLGILYARKSLSPIREMLRTIQFIEKGDLTQRVPTSKSRDELQELGETFNRMIVRIEALVRIMGESLDNVAHDIRTPLTRLRAVAEDALVSVRHDALKEALEDCAETAAGISGLVDQLLSISEADAGTLSLRYEDCDIRTLVKDVADIYEFVAIEKNISLDFSFSDTVRTWKLDRKRTKQVVGNLLDNAIKFSPRDSAILISTQADSKGLRISVEDQGPGIHEDELARIWDRLYRGDKSRSTKGSGLGLSIVRSIVIAHKGYVEAVGRDEGGMRFSFYLP